MSVKEVRVKVYGKKVSKNSGRSCSSEYPTGLRRKVEGQERAPKSLRAKGKSFLSECTEEELDKIGLK
jgi:hypothetical protein